MVAAFQAHGVLVATCAVMPVHMEVRHGAHMSFQLSTCNESFVVAPVFGYLFKQILS